MTNRNDKLKSMTPSYSSKGLVCHGYNGKAKGGNYSGMFEEKLKLGGSGVGGGGGVGGDYYSNPNVGFERELEGSEDVGYGRKSKRNRRGASEIGIR